MDEKERDDVSIWCYDGMCGQCGDDGCEHHCHTVDDVEKVKRDFVGRGTGAIALGVWTVAAGWELVVPDDWTGMREFGAKGLVIVVVYMLVSYIVRGLERPE